MKLKCTKCHKVLEEETYFYVLTYCRVIDKGNNYERREDCEIFCIDCIPMK